jgi:hypothetical protein
MLIKWKPIVQMRICEAPDDINNLFRVIDDVINFLKENSFGGSKREVIFV